MWTAPCLSVDSDAGFYFGEELFYASVILAGLINN
jgi:hypothetical protein